MIQKIIGIDPGCKGAIARIETDGTNHTVVEWQDLPNPNDMDWTDYAVQISEVIDDMIGGGVDAIVIEKPPSHTRNRAGIAKYLLSAGICYGAAAHYAGSVASYRPFVATKIANVSPQVWKAHYGLAQKKLTDTQYKRQSRTLASELFDNEDPPWARQCDVDRAEAALIALYWAQEGQHSG